VDYNFIWVGPTAGAPIVTIATYGISFNSYVISLMGNPAKVLIGFDEKNKILGVKPVDDSNDHIAYDFAKKERKGYVRISNKDFIKYISAITGNNFKKAERYLANWDDKTKVLTVNLMQPMDSFVKKAEEDA